MAQAPVVRFDELVIALQFDPEADDTVTAVP
jgi:predicted transcriptional regulator